MWYRPLSLELSPEEEVVTSMHMDIIRCSLHDICFLTQSIAVKSIMLSRIELKKIVKMNFPGFMIGHILEIFYLTCLVIFLPVDGLC